jgi:hypothetical protein
MQSTIPNIKGQGHEVFKPIRLQIFQELSAANNFSRSKNTLKTNLKFPIDYILPSPQLESDKISQINPSKEIFSSYNIGLHLIRIIHYSQMVVWYHLTGMEVPSMWSYLQCKITRNFGNLLRRVWYVDCNFVMCDIMVLLFLLSMRPNETAEFLTTGYYRSNQFHLEYKYG